MVKKAPVKKTASAAKVSKTNGPIGKKIIHKKSLKLAQRKSSKVESLVKVSEISHSKSFMKKVRKEKLCSKAVAESLRKLRAEFIHLKKVLQKRSKQDAKMHVYKVSTARKKLELSKCRTSILRDLVRFEEAIRRETREKFNKKADK